jgi:hypothetical protein
VEAALVSVSASTPAMTAAACDAQTIPVKLFGFTKIMALFFVELPDLDVAARSVDDTRLALLLPFLDSSMNGLPVLGCAVLLEPPILELAFILPFAK